MDRSPLATRPVLNSIAHCAGCWPWGAGAAALVYVGLAAAQSRLRPEPDRPPSRRRIPARPRRRRTRAQLCAAAARHQARCFALVRTDVSGRTGVPGRPGRLRPGRHAVDAYDLPSDYRRGRADRRHRRRLRRPERRGRPRRVPQRSTGCRPARPRTAASPRSTRTARRAPLPDPDAGWAQEISLDLDMVSAACPQCNILLVEADDNYTDNLAAAVDTAVALGAKYVSNSYGGTEDPSETDFDAYYNHPGVVVTASTGDDGYGTSYPATAPGVTAVGGTSLVADSSTRGWAESAWAGAGSGCSPCEPKPDFQTDAGCANRRVADVSAVADPETGVAVYDSYQFRRLGRCSAAPARRRR